MTRLLSFLFAALIFQVASGTVAAGENPSALLTEEQVRQAIPLLNTYIKDSSEIIDSGRKTMDEIREDAVKREMRSGKTATADPLADITANGGKPPLPKGATYQSACSGAITLSRGGKIPIAVFSFGKSIDCMTKREFSAGNVEQWLASGSDSGSRCSMEHDQAEKLIKSITAFYEEKQYPGKDVRSDHGGTLDIQVGFTIPEHPSVDRSERRARECTSTPDGVTLFISQNPFAGANEAADAAAARNMKRRTVGLSDEQIDETLRIGALLKTARDQAAVPVDPEMQRLRERLPPELIAVFKESENNIKMYLKYKTELDPLLDRMGTMNQ